MALPAGRYGVTKNQLLKIKKLPMNTIKLIEELTEKFNLLGTAAFKNSTSVVTDSTDLVESGAVYTALQTKADNSVIGTVEDGTTASQAYAVGSHAIRNGQFITWKNAKVQGETINDASDYTSGDVAGCLDLLLRVAPLSQYDGNCDNLSAGFVYVNTNATNVPEAWCIVITLSSSIGSLASSNMIQIALPISTLGKIYTRAKQSNTWSSWYTFDGTVIS